MKGETEDWSLLDSLGVTSVKPEDIERHILEQSKKSDADGNGAEIDTNREYSNGTSSASLSDRYNKLQAVNTEIKAVRSTFELENASEDEGTAREQDIKEEQESGQGEKNLSRARPNDRTLQYALASDRLKSLAETKAQLEKEISEASKDGKCRDLIKSIVAEDHKPKPKPKQKLKKVQESSKPQSKKLKRASLLEDDDFDAVLNAASAGFVETERDELVRKGVFTPFHKLKGFERRVQEAGSSSRNEIADNADRSDEFATSSIARAARSISEAAQARPTSMLLDSEELPKLDAPTRPFQRLKAPLILSGSSKSEAQKSSDRKRKKRPLPSKRWRRLSSREETLDGGNAEDDEDAVVEETSFVSLEGGLNVPEAIFSGLFDYQKVGVQWLWELHCQKAGGIIGDEMGLGKTIQVIAFLGSLHFSGMYKPSIVICPVTLLRQWKREVQKWYPDFHVELLHESAQDVSSRKKQENSESDYESEDSSDNDVRKSSTSKNKWEALINRVMRARSGLLITTYEQLRVLGEKLLDHEWGYAILDEGHRIRNPNAEITLVCKQLQTVHRIIMTGAPIQNKLSELWSLFDFVFPGKLGVLPVFEAEFAVPISVGGYANASPLQVSTAYRCAVVLRDLIMPYLLRRMKADVNAQLTKKTEHVLFCSLTEGQRSVYRAFLASSEVEDIFNGSKNSLYGIDVMRKICNHPDLLEREHSCNNPDYGNPVRSGKLKVVTQVLKAWKEQGHHVLLFSQTQQMLDIIENLIAAEGYTYRRMDGSTPIRQRMALIDEFNNSTDVFIFILTTKVGGLGTNLTGADRVIIFDPDWNPSNDMQARERAWRIGQKRDVTVYRLITRGTIEEKVYHRQIYKHFLTSKILSNPQQKRFFKARDMKDLFTLTDDGNGTETSNLFSQLSEDTDVLATPNDSQREHSATDIVKPNANDRQTCSEGEKMDDDNNGKSDEGTNILQSLFGAHGIHSAMDHDAIMNAHDEEKLRMDAQASQVAQRAAEALRQSRMLRSRESVSVPTWTGKSGAAGAPGRKFGSTVNSQLSKNSSSTENMANKRSNGLVAGASSGKALSSAELLARIRGTQESAVNQGLEHQFGLAAASSSNARRPVRNNTSGPSKASVVQPEILIRQLCTFIQRNGGSCGSGIIVDHFKDRIPSKDLPLFKNLLKEIAMLEKSSGSSVWVLKPEYQE